MSGRRDARHTGLPWACDEDAAPKGLALLEATLVLWLMTYRVCREHCRCPHRRRESEPHTVGGARVSCPVASWNALSTVDTKPLSNTEGRKGFGSVLFLLHSFTMTLDTEFVGRISFSVSYEPFNSFDAATSILGIPRSGYLQPQLNRLLL